MVEVFSAHWTSSAGCCGRNLQIFRQETCRIFFEEPWPGEFTWVDDLAAFRGICPFPRFVSSCSRPLTASHGRTGAPSSYLYSRTAAYPGRGKFTSHELLATGPKSGQYLGRQADATSRATTRRFLTIARTPHHQGTQLREEDRTSRIPVPRGDPGKVRGVSLVEYLAGGSDTSPLQG